MKLSINIKPQIKTAQTKSDLFSKIAFNHYYSCGTNYSGLISVFGRTGSNKEMVRVYTLQKFRTKTEQVKYQKSSVAHGYRKGQTKHSNVLRKNHWVAHIYDLDIVLLKKLGLQVQQKTRNFTITSAKKRR